MTVPSRSTLIRLIVALLLTAVIIWRADPSAVMASLGRLSAGWTLVAIGLVLIDRALMAWRWLALLRGVAATDHLPARTVLRIFFVSTFVGTFLPASIGSDAVRAYGLSKEKVLAADSIASVLMDRLLGVISLLAAAVAGLLLATDLLREPAVQIALAAAAAGCVIGVAAIYSESAARLLGGVAARLPRPALRRVAEGLVLAVRAYATRHRALATVLTASMVVQVVRVMQAYALGRGLGIHADWTAYAAFVPLIMLVMMLPISIFGLGTSQWAFEGLFTQVGVAREDAVALSLLFIALGVLGNLPGALLYVSGRSERPADAAA